MDISIEDAEPTGMKQESRDPWIPNFTSVPYIEKDYTGGSFDYAVDVPSPIMTIDLHSSPICAEIDCPQTPVTTPQKDQQPCEKNTSPENLSSPISSGISPNESASWSNPALSKALRDRHIKDSSGGTRSRLRTPRTLTRLMQQHRENERHRHRGINASIKEISKRIPGYEETANETKIVKLQRIINYICHLEEHIQGICGDIGLDLDFKHLFLSPHISKPEPKRHPVPPTQQPSASAGVSVVSSTVATPKRTATSFQTKGMTPNQASKKTVSGQGMKISSPTIDSTTADSLCKNGRSQRRCQRARNLKEACASAAQAKAHNLDRLESENDSDATLEEVCQVLQQAGNITPEIEKSLEWLGHIAASPDSSLLVCDDYNLNALDLQQPIPDEQADEIFRLCSPDWLKDTECVSGGKADESPEKDADILTIHNYARLTPEKSQQPFLWNGDPNTLSHGQVIKLEALKQTNPRGGDLPEVIYISDSPVYDTDSQGSIICQFPDNMEVAEQCEITDSPPSPVKSEGGRSLDLNMMGNLCTSKCQITAISPVNGDCPSDRNKQKASTPQRILPFAMYTMVVESDSGGSFPSLSDEDNIIHCQFQGIQCLEDNRRLLQKQKERELAEAAEAAMVELDEADIAEAITALRCPPYDWMDELSSSSTTSPTAVNPSQGLRNANGAFPPVIDHRKTSWMNGFMMYSRIHRREYIEKHPGTHTSYISKLMGQDWRELSPEEQQPYRNQAKEYAKNYLAPVNTPFDFENDP